MKYTLDGVEHDDEASHPGPLDEFFELVIGDCAAFIDFLCSIPPLSWLDALMRGFVGPRD